MFCVSVQPIADEELRRHVRRSAGEGAVQPVVRRRTRNACRGPSHPGTVFSHHFQGKRQNYCLLTVWGLNVTK